jgi:MFS family permease
MTGAVFGGMTIFYGLGAMTSPALTGHLADITGTFRWSFGLGASIALIAALCIGLIRGREISRNEGD